MVLYQMETSFLKVDADVFIEISSVRQFMPLSQCKWDFSI